MLGLSGDLSSQTRDWIWLGECIGPPALGAWDLSHWTTRDVPILVIFKTKSREPIQKQTYWLMLWSECVAPAFICCNPDQPGDGFWRWGLWKWWGNESRIFMSGIDALMWELPRPPHEDTVRRLWGGWFSGDIKSASTLILNFPVSRSVGNECLLFISLPVCGILLKQPKGTQIACIIKSPVLHSAWLRESNKSSDLNYSLSLSPDPGHLCSLHSEPAPPLKEP